MSITANQLIESPYRDQIAYFVTGADLTAYFPNSKIVKFSDLEKYSTIYDLLPATLDFCFILVETTGIGEGHWQMVLRNGHNFEFFDSYADEPTTILNFVPKYLNKLLGNDYNKDMGHILKSIKKGDKLTINKFPYQSNTDDVNTCGKWILIRLMSFLEKNWTNKELAKFIKQKSKETGLKYDEVVCTLIQISN
jgi:hypothetical protein